jgi:hypothetical protein
MLDLGGKSWRRGGGTNTHLLDLLLSATNKKGFITFSQVVPKVELKYDPSEYFQKAWDDI